MWMEVGKVRLIQDSFSQVDIASGMAIEGMCYAQVCGCCPSPCMPVSTCWASGGARGTSCAIHDQLNRPLPAQRVSLNDSCSSQSAWADPRGTTLLSLGLLPQLPGGGTFCPHREKHRTEIPERKNGFLSLCQWPQ